MISGRDKLYVEMRLNDWANWMLRIEAGGEGWPKSSLLAILLDIGAVIRAPVKTSPFMYDEAEEIDCWIKRMGKEKPHYETVVRSYYLRKNEPLRLVIKSLNIPRSTYFEYLADAKHWLGEKVQEKVEVFGLI